MQSPHPTDRDHHTTSGKAEPFGHSYDKARTSYGIATALLLAWALIGIDLQPDVLSNYKITVKSPQAAPFVLIAAVLYFGFRFTIEWYQANPMRRELTASRIDYIVAHVLGASAIALYLVQAIIGSQLANNPSIWRLLLVLLLASYCGFALGAMLSRTVRREWLEQQAKSMRRAVIVVLCASGVLVVFVLFSWHPKMFLMILALSHTLASAVFVLREQHESEKWRNLTNEQVAASIQAAFPDQRPKRD